MEQPDPIIHQPVRLKIMSALKVLPADEPIELDVIETDALTLPPDYVPLRNEELDDLWERASISRQTLFDALLPAPESAIDWRENAEAWSVRNALEHLARADLWYASRLEEGGMRELVWRLSAARALVLQHLQNVPADARGRVTTHEGEEWTPRKVARRMLEHEWEHLAQIRDMLSQVK